MGKRGAPIGNKNALGHRVRNYFSAARKDARRLDTSTRAVNSLFKKHGAEGRSSLIFAHKEFLKGKNLKGLSSDNKKGIIPIGDVKKYLKHQDRLDKGYSNSSATRRFVVNRFRKTRGY